MRLLLDESVNFRLNRYLFGHSVSTTKQMGWDSYDNGNLLALARDSFDVLITRDQNMENQQNLTSSDVAIVVMYAKSNAMRDLELMAPRILEVLDTVQRGHVVRIYS